ncbi:MAG: glycosyl hydrolase 115 family protein, partial [Clostridia bacterium]|nr:glycosyl hydrolase 115 family protein [Clostridia bacterium]
MKRFIIYAVCAAALAATLTAAVSAANNSVSGYVSLTEGEQIAGFDISMCIEYDENEDKSVVRAIGDLKDDFKSVTGKDCTEWVNWVHTDSQYSLQALPPHGICKFGDDDIEVLTFDNVPVDSVCYIASYTPDGALYALKQSTTPGQSVDGKTNSFLFDSLPDRIEFGTLKAFIWTGESKMEPATDEQLEFEDSYTTVRIGTLGLSEQIDDYAKTNAQIAALEGKRESFTIQNINGNIVIAGSDKRGTIYGIYDLSEKMGVSPWEFWADVEPEKAENLYINLPTGGYTEGEPSVEYRGIFLNDEYNMNQWTNSLFPQNMNLAKYEKVYELILRLKMNTLWPAMHQYSTPFHNIDGAAAKADEYGIVVGSSHAEPLLRNNLGELDSYQDAWEAAHPDKTLYKAIQNETKKWVAYYWTDHDADGNAVDNKEFLTDYWRDSVKASGQYDNIYTLGMRGVHDGSFQTNMDYETALKEIIA